MSRVPIQRPLPRRTRRPVQHPAPVTAGPRVTGVARLGVIRATALGDLVQALPALEALRAAYPEAEIAWVGTPLHRDLLEGRPGPVDRVIALPPGAVEALGRTLRAGAGRAGPGSPAEVPDGDLRPADILARLRAERFDLVVQLHGGGRESNPFALALGARVTAGAHDGGGPRLDRSLPYVLYQPETLRALEVVGLVGAPPVTIEPRLEVTGADRAAASAVLPDDGRPLAVLHPGATDPRRRWPADRFAAVGDALAERGLAIAVTGQGEEAALTADVIAAMRHPARDLADRLSMPALVGLLARARLVVSNDTGPLHLAGAVGTRSVGIYWYGNLLTAGPTFRSRSRAATGWRPDCPVCGADATESRGCEHRASFVADVPVSRVLELAADLLEGR